MMPTFLATPWPSPCTRATPGVLHPSAFRECTLVIPRCLFPSSAFRAAFARWRMSSGALMVVLNPQHPFLLVKVFLPNAEVIISRQSRLSLALSTFFLADSLGFRSGIDFRTFLAQFSNAPAISRLPVFLSNCFDPIPPSFYLVHPS